MAPANYQLSGLTRFTAVMRDRSLVTIHRHDGHQLGAYFSAALLAIPAGEGLALNSADTVPAETLRLLQAWLREVAQ